MPFFLNLFTGALGAPIAAVVVLLSCLLVNQAVENPLVRREAARQARAELLARLDLAGELARRQSAEWLVRLQRLEMETLEQAAADDRAALQRFEQARAAAEADDEQRQIELRSLAAESAGEGVAGDGDGSVCDPPLGGLLERLRNR